MTGGSSLLPQTLLMHTYEVERLLASGGMGEVYLARHMELGSRHAIKVIRPQLMTSLSESDALELFRREATILRGIRNDAVVGYEGFFRDEQKNVYLVTEYVDGPSLAQVLTQGALSLKDVYLLRDRLCKGLAAVHEKGIIHRDMSPDNIILPGSDVNAAKLIDFGIAKLNNPGAVTIIGNAFVGKLRYAAPEQLGLFGGTVSPATDIYSLGLVLAAAALGGPFYMGDTVQAAFEARRQVPDLRDVPAALQPQLRAMLQPNPADRPQRMTELLERWPIPPSLSPDKAVTELKPAVPVPRVPQVESRVESRPRGYRGYLLALGAGLLIIAAGGGLFWLLEEFKPPAAPGVVSVPESIPPSLPQPGSPPVPLAKPEARDIPSITAPGVTAIKPEARDIPSAMAPEVTEPIEPPVEPPAEPAANLAAPAKPQVRDMPSTPAPGVATTNRLPLSPPAEPAVPKIDPGPQKKPPAASSSQKPPPKPALPAKPTQAASDARSQKEPPGARDGLKSRRCGDILSRITLGESLSNEDRTFLTKECR